jgi:NAD(P)-dependent dehydrogenase (short-subunit alcohol dehydrogenase family)
MAEPKSWLITGANRGIGLRLARAVLEHGEHDQVLASVRKSGPHEQLDALCETYPGRVVVLECELISSVSVREMGRQLEEHLQGRALDRLVNNAGILLEYEEGIASLDLAEVERMLSVNTLGPMRVTRACLPALGRSSRPVIAQITSDLGSISDNQMGVAYGYRMSKAALNMFNKTLSIEEPGIVCVCLHPGWVRTDMGGAQAPVGAAESAEGIRHVIEKLGIPDSGKFLDYLGEEHPW